MPAFKLLLSIDFRMTPISAAKAFETSPTGAVNRPKAILKVMTKSLIFLYLTVAVNLAARAVSPIRFPSLLSGKAPALKFVVSFITIFSPSPLPAETASKAANCYEAFAKSSIPLFL
jgi:hypothetical protein